MNEEMLARSERRISEPLVYQRCQDQLREYRAEAEHEARLRQASANQSGASAGILALRWTLGVALIQAGQRLQGTYRPELAARPMA